MTGLTARPDFGKMQLDVFQGKDPGGILWQPRIDYWYKVNKKRGTLPPHLHDASLLDVYDYCHASCRYFLWDEAWLHLRQKTVEVTSVLEDEKRKRQTWHTPIGELSQLLHYDEWNISPHIVEYRVKQPEDLKILRYILEDETWHWDEDTYQEYLNKFGDYGAPQFYFRRSPVQNLIISEMCFEQAIYFMIDHPKLLEEYVEFETAADDAMYDELCSCPDQILNFGENIDGSLNPPRIWKEHLAPYYTKRTEQLHAAGKYVYIHVDGTMKPLLPHMQDCPWDAIEAATPIPQGDVTLEEIKESLGDLILLDGIPALYFLPEQYPMEDLIKCVRRVVELFYPRLVLGVSDEVPPDSDIERVRFVGELIKELV